MNLVLNAPLPTSEVLRNDYDNKVLYAFLILMTFLIVLGWLFIDLAGNQLKSSPYNTTNNTNTTDNPPPSKLEYA